VNAREETLLAKIEAAFSDVRYPGDEDLTDSAHGEEPKALVEDFRGKTDWRALSPKFIDRAGQGAALSFFSAAALQALESYWRPRFYCHPDAHLRLARARSRARRFPVSGEDRAPGHLQVARLSPATLNAVHVPATHGSVAAVHSEISPGPQAWPQCEPVKPEPTS